MYLILGNLIWVVEITETSNVRSGSDGPWSLIQNATSNEVLQSKTTEHVYSFLD